MYRLGDVLEPLQPEVLDGLVEAMAHVPVDAVRDADRPGPGDRLETRGDVDGVAMGGTRPQQDIAVVHADADAESLARELLRRNPLLDLDCDRHRRHHAIEGGEEGVPRDRFDAASVLGDDAPHEHL